LPITHIGSVILPLTGRQYLLKELLRVPLIYNNRLSIHKFAHYNSVFFEFRSSYFVIKDCQTGIPLHQGPIKDGLYQLNPLSATSSSIKQALVGERTSTDH
jgi:hypothetical protein